MPNGLILRAVSNADWIHREQYPLGAHGIIELVDWEANTLWSYRMDQPGRNVLHHDFEVMPNGNIMVTAYVGFTIAEAVEIGFDPALANGDIVWFESIIEVSMDFEKQAARLVWQWNSWGHIIQDEYSHKLNYGVISENPGRIDVNANQLDTLPFNNGEVHQINSIAYNAELDQVLLSSATTGEIWIIDHSTTRAEAATDTGGKAGQGGRLLYRWGNPGMLDSERSDRTLFWQQDAKWVSSDNPDSPSILIYNSGIRREMDGKENKEQPFLGLGSAYTDLIEISLPVHESDPEKGLYNVDAAPSTTWTWNANGFEDFYSPFSGSITRLPNGYTVIMQSQTKRILEITPEGERVLDFRIPGPGRIFNIEKIPLDHTGLVQLVR